MRVEMVQDQERYIFCPENSWNFLNSLELLLLACVNGPGMLVAFIKIPKILCILFSPTISALLFKLFSIFP